MDQHLFACSKCFKRYPFEELSAGKQMCKTCVGPKPSNTTSSSSSSTTRVYPPAKCTHCKQEFQPTSKPSEQPACKRCEGKITRYGPPKPCSLCNVLAAFGSPKCDRCTHYEKKYGPPRQCDNCKQKCAFDKPERPEEKSMLNGKKLCWVCMLSVKKDTRKSSTDPSRKRKLSGRDKRKHSSTLRDPDFDDSSRGSLTMSSTTSTSGVSSSGTNNPAKMGRQAGGDETDLTSSDHMATIAQMREEIANLKKQLASKDQQLLQKERMITELKAQMHNTEQQFRQKSKCLQKNHEDEMSELRGVTKELQIKVASLTKLTKKSGIVNNNNSNASSQNNSPDSAAP